MKSGSILFGAVIGLAVGGLVGLLFAPKKGAVTRRFIAKKGNDYMGDMKDRINESMNDVNQKIDSLKQEVKNLRKKSEKEYKNS